jgi:hypothetical protein
MAAEGSFDPYEFTLVGIVAGIRQADNSYPAFGQGMKGFARRYGTVFADQVDGNIMVGGVYPTILKTDPRYFRLGRARSSTVLEGINQNGADRVALYAAAASGFSPEAYVELFDRSAETNGNRGSVLNVVFGTTTSNPRRLREIKKALKQLPQPCQEIVPAASAEFRTWQAAVMSATDLARR